MYVTDERHDCYIAVRNNKPFKFILKYPLWILSYVAGLQLTPPDLSHATYCRDTGT